MHQKTVVPSCAADGLDVKEQDITSDSCCAMGYVGWANVQAVATAGDRLRRHDRRLRAVATSVFILLVGFGVAAVPKNGCAATRHQETGSKDGRHQSRGSRHSDRKPSVAWAADTEEKRTELSTRPPQTA